MIPGDLLSAFPHGQFHTQPGLLDSWAALPNSNPNPLRAMQGGSLYHFYDGLWYDPAERRTHDLPCERRTRYRLSQPDRKWFVWSDMHIPMVFFFIKYILLVIYYDGTPINCPLRRTWSVVNTPLPPGIEPRAVACRSICTIARFLDSFYLYRYFIYIDFST